MAQLVRLELTLSRLTILRYNQLNYSRTKMVGGEGVEPPVYLTSLIYSQLSSPLDIPTHF